MLRTLSSAETVPHSNRFENKVCLDSKLVIDTLDNPSVQKLLNQSSTEQNIFQNMKYEKNRFLSYKDKWPISHINPSDLAEAGFFYLQNEDRVQCPFCYLIVQDWTYGDKPLREHMKNSPKCPFLMSYDVGNVAILTKPNYRPKPIFESSLMHSVQPNVSYKPKHPQMADVKRRLLTYTSWPLRTHSPEQMAECGFFYTGKNDEVTCYFCGGHLGNWETDDNPWTEHEKFYPHCAFLPLSKNRRQLNKRVDFKPKELPSNHLVNGVTKSCNSVSKGIIDEAKKIFPDTLVNEVMKSKSGHLTSLQDLCDDILEWKNRSSSVETAEFKGSGNCVGPEKNAVPRSDALLCKICMDEERGVVFQPCGHLVACSKCAKKVFDCPLCRRPITNLMNVFFG